MLTSASQLHTSPSCHPPQKFFKAKTTWINTTTLILTPPPSHFLQAVYEEIQSHKPDVVRQTVRENYRYDENVLPSKPAPERKIIVPTSGAAEVIYANGMACVCVCV